MELTGKVILDEKSMEALKEKMRDEIINEIKEKGNYSSEIKKYLNDCSYQHYVSLIEDTIYDKIDDIEKERVAFETDRIAYKKLIAIRAILDL